MVDVAGLRSLERSSGGAPAACLLSVAVTCSPVARSVKMGLVVGESAGTSSLRLSGGGKRRGAASGEGQGGRLGLDVGEEDLDASFSAKGQDVVFCVSRISWTSWDAICLGTKVFWEIQNVLSGYKKLFLTFWEVKSGKCGFFNGWRPKSGSKSRTNNRKHTKSQTVQAETPKATQTVKGMYPAPHIHEHFTIHKWLRQTAYILTHNLNMLEHIANNCMNTTMHTDANIAQF